MTKLTAKKNGMDVEALTTDLVSVNVEDFCRVLFVYQVFRIVATVTRASGRGALQSSVRCDTLARGLYLNCCS